MPNSKKVEVVKNLKEVLKSAPSLILTHYQGLNTTQIESLKKEVEKANAKMLIVKNTLLNVVLKDLKIELPPESFKGPTALVLAFDEGLKALKSLVNFGKTAGGLPSFKLSLIEGHLYDAADSLALATLPSREVLLSKLVTLLNSPLTRLVISLKSDQRKLVLVLNAVAKKKS